MVSGSSRTRTESRIEARLSGIALEDRVSRRHVRIPQLGFISPTFSLTDLQVHRLSHNDGTGDDGNLFLLRRMKIGENGTVAFIARLAVGVGGVDVTNNMGIWVGTSDSDLRLLVRTSDIIDGNALIKLPRDLGMFDMNEKGIAWEGGFLGGPQALAVAAARVRRPSSSQAMSRKKRRKNSRRAATRITAQGLLENRMAQPSGTVAPAGTTF
jgi:hypothetical protein